MNIHHLELFYYVARHGGITEAVRNIPYGIQQPAVSGQVAQLEEFLGVVLFQRRPFALSTAGEKLYKFITPFFSNLEAIAAVEGVDGLFIGPSDLAAALGHLGDSGHPEVRAAIEDAFQRMRKAGRAPGILAPIEADARHWLSLGCVVLAVGSDVGLLARSSEALAAKFKSGSR